jgi:hypothetical protein
MVVALLEHIPERHVRPIAVVGQVECSQSKWKRLELEGCLAAEKRFARERVDFRNMLIRHGVTDRRRH